MKYLLIEYHEELWKQNFISLCTGDSVEVVGKQHLIPNAPGLYRVAFLSTELVDGTEADYVLYPGDPIYLEVWKGKFRLYRHLYSDAFSIMWISEKMAQAYRLRDSFDTVIEEIYGGGAKQVETENYLIEEDADYYATAWE